MKRQKIIGIDICKEALTLARKGELISNEHLSICPICQRRATIVLADAAGWMPITHHRAAGLMETMIAHFVHNTKVAEADRTGFYAHLARCEGCEGDFASMIYAELTPTTEEMSSGLKQWRETLPERLKAHREEMETNDSATEDSQ